MAMTSIKAGVFATRCAKRAAPGTVLRAPPGGADARQVGSAGVRGALGGVVVLIMHAAAGLWLATGADARPVDDPAALCDAAARAAARSSAVPLEVLAAVALVETGRADARGTPRPWPWAINVAGQGAWHATPEDALRAARRALAAGVRNVDLGCFQINHRWHSHAFPSLEAMLDPVTNARYAAQLLAGHYARRGSWPAAAAAYHSATPVHAQRYRKRFEATLAALRNRTETPQGVARSDGRPAPLSTAAASHIAAAAAPGSLFAANSTADTPVATPGALSLEAIR